MKQGSGRGSRSVCRISEFSCSRGKCVPGDKYCDGVDDCGDGSDEPRFCTRKSLCFFTMYMTFPVLVFL